MASTASESFGVGCGEVDGGQLVDAHRVVGDDHRGRRGEELLAHLVELRLHRLEALEVLRGEVVELVREASGRPAGAAWAAARPTGRSPSGVHRLMTRSFGLSWAGHRWYPTRHNYIGSGALPPPGHHRVRRVVRTPPPALALRGWRMSASRRPLRWFSGQRPVAIDPHRAQEVAAPT